MKIHLFVLIALFGFVLTACGGAETESSLEPTLASAATVPVVLETNTPIPLPSFTPESESVETAVATLDSSISAPEKMPPIEDGTPSGEVKPETPDQKMPVIVYERSGGFTGANDVWMVFGDGTIVGPRDDSKQKAPAAVDATVQLAEKAGFFELNDEYMPKITCCDFFTYVITIQSDAGVKTVTTMDTAEMPQALELTKTAVEALIFD